MKEKMIMDRILDLQIMLREDCESDISLEEILLFLESAMNFGAFQIELLEYKLEGRELSYTEEIRLFLSKNSNEDILRLYKIMYNFNDVNIEGIEERLSNGIFGDDDDQVKVKINKKIG